ncbi:uncharacterized protein LOC135946498 [Cloeon dipterum]|uniref:uncharacterized protein LOC135946498 n=1 Tax=Cloeon dipterum TaxID=197152 RepID=UPI00321FBE7A
MGNYRSKAATDIENQEGAGPFYKFAAASMQGWRINQEDAHACLPEFDMEKGIALFAVFDGHGGPEVSQYCASHLADHIKNDLAYKTGDLKEALEESFMTFDKSLRTPEVIKKLKEILKTSLSGSDDDSEVEQEDMQGLLEDACAPLEKVLQNYALKKLEEHGKLPNGSDSKEEGKTDDVANAGAEGTSIAGSTSSSAGGSSGAGGSGSGGSIKAGGSGTSPSRPGRGQRKAVEPKEGVAEASADKDSSDEDSEDETFDTEDESEEDDSSEGGSGSEGGEDEEDEDESEEDDDDEDEGMMKSRDLLMKLLKRKRKAVEACDDEEEDESGPKKKIFCGLSSTPAMESGTTAVVALLGKEKVTVANIGDSRAILGRLVKTENGHEMKVIELSNDHKPELPEEKERIENAGGVVDDDGRVDGGLNLSRAFGDFVFKSNKDMPAEKQEVIAFPDVISVDLKFEQDEADQFLFVACDGIWNDMSSDNVADFIWTRLEKHVPMKDILEQMFKHILAPNMSGDGTGCDNMTAVIVRFDGPEKAEQSENNSSSTKEESDMK